MSKIKNVLTVVVGLSLMVMLAVLITPTKTRGQGGNQHPLNVNVVNLYPAHPIQKELTLPSTPEKVCVPVPEGQAMIVELVTARTFAISNAEGHFVLGLETTAGGEEVPHNIVLQRQPTGEHTAFFGTTQPLRVYADPGTDVCLRAQSFDGGPFTPIVTFSGQLVDLH
jgi:hypothetical protein